MTLGIQVGMRDGSAVLGSGYAMGRLNGMPFNKWTVY